jgi:hypothetical protein
MQTYIKCVNLSRKKFDVVNNDICLRYLKLREKNKISFLMFQQGILFAYILGNLTAHQDREAMQIFFASMSSQDIPKIKIIKEENNVKICMAVFADKKYARK